MGGYKDIFWFQQRIKLILKDESSPDLQKTRMNV